MSDQTLFDAVMKFYQIYNDHNLGFIDQIFMPTYVGHVNAHDIVGIESAKGFIEGFIQGIPDAYYDIKEMMTSGNRVITRWVCTGTQTGNFYGMPPTNKSIKVTGITIFEILDGKINQLWNNWDQFTLMQQLQA